MMSGFTELAELREEISEEHKTNPSKSKPRKDEGRPDPKKMSGEDYMRYLDMVGGGKF